MRSDEAIEQRDAMTTSIERLLAGVLVNGQVAGG
jgi:hypothetical protein